METVDEKTYVKGPNVRLGAMDCALGAMSRIWGQILKLRLVAFVAVVSAFDLRAADYKLDLSDKSGDVYWDQTDGLWSGGAEGTDWYPYPEPDAQGALPNLAVTVGANQVNLFCHGLTDGRSFPMSYNSITFDKGNYHFLTKSSVTCAIGAGGLAALEKFGEMSGNFSLLASQTWKQSGVTADDAKTGIRCSLSAGPDVTWTVAGVARLVFADGSSDQFQAKTYSNSGFFLSGTNQFNRLGGNGLTLTADRIEGLDSCPRLVFNYPQGADGSVDVNTPLSLDFKTPNEQSYPLNWIGLACDDSEPDMCVNLTQPLTGVIGHRSLLFGQTGHHPYKLFFARYEDVGLFRGDQQRLVLSGDNSELVPYGSEERKQIFVTTILSAAHANALGTGNAAFDFEFAPGRFSGFNSRLIRGIVGLTARNGVSIGANLIARANHNTGANKGKGHMFTVLLGTDDNSESTFSGTYHSTTKDDKPSESWDYRTFPEVRFTAGAGGTARFTGELTLYCLREVSGLGDVVLANGGNKWASDIRETYGFPIRSGRLVAAHADAVKDQKIRLGGLVPSKHSVRCMSARMWQKGDLGNAWPVLSGSDLSHTNDVVTFTSAPATIDGVQYAKDDVVVVNAVQSCDKDGPSLNGVWKVMNDDRTVWRRVDWLDDDSDVRSGHGIRIKVEDGVKFGGRSFFFALHEEFSHSESVDHCFSFAKADWLPYLCFHDEAANEPDVGFMAEGELTIANKIDVTENLSSGKSAIGGTTAHEATFTGTVTCYKGELTVSAVAGGKVTFSGNVTNANVATTLVKEGAGEVVLNPASNRKLKLDGGLVLKEGALTAPASFVSEKASLAFVRNGGTTGTLNVQGDCDLSGKTLVLTGFGTKPDAGEPSQLVLMTSTGTLSGQPVVAAHEGRWNVKVKGNRLVAGYVHGFVATFR